MGVMTGLLTLAMAFGAFLAGLVMSRGFKQSFCLTGGIGLAAMILVATIMWKGNKTT
jgi:predicted MFS family arabinose efflux permease